MPSINNKIIYLGPNVSKMSVLKDYRDGEDISSDSNITHIGPISSINILVGANNSGKSRFMRALLKAEGHVLFAGDDILESYYNFFKLLEQLQDKIKGSHIQFRIMGFDNEGLTSDDFLGPEHQEFFNSRSDTQFTINNGYISAIINNIRDLMSLAIVDLRERFSEVIKYFKIIRIAYKVSLLDKNHTMYPMYKNYTLTYSLSNIYNTEINLLKNLSVISLELEKGLSIEFPSKRIYIPILRAARALLSDIEDGKQMTIVERRALTSIFKVTVAKSYDLLDKGIEINTGLDLYTRISRNRNDSKSSRTMFDKFEAFISASFFQNREFEIVAKYAEPGQEEHLHVSINGAEHEIHFLGDGIQSLITLLYPIFLAEKGAWVFIEEPEVHLHPGMQRLFIETLLNNSVIREKELVIFLTTHSNHLFDIAIENQHSASVLAFRKLSEEPATFSVSSTNQGEIHILNLLEVSNSSVFMANCAIWVEGPTDRIYLRKYLEEYIKAKHPNFILHEDLNYCFFEYAGSNLSHYVFSKEPDELSASEERKINAWFLANRIFLIADSDSGKEKKHSRLFREQNDNFTYYQITVREIENLLSPSIIASELPKIIGGRAKFDKAAWIAAIAASPLLLKDYKNEYLARFLESKYSSLKFPKTFKGESGTFSARYKVRLANQIALAVTWSQMTNEAQKLAESLFHFIVKHNPLLANGVNN